MVDPLKKKIPKREDGGSFEKENPKERGLVDPLKKKILAKEGGWWIL